MDIFSSLGLVTAAIATILSNKDLVGSLLFCLALNHKQMRMYYAPAFFSCLLGKCLRRPNPVSEVLKLGLVVLGTFALVWWPYLDSVDSCLQVLSRLAPFERGIYEDYVAKFWCATSIIVKWRRLFSTESLRFFCLAATASICLPSMIQLVQSPTKHGFLYGLLTCSTAYFTFSNTNGQEELLMLSLSLSHYT